MGFYVDGRWQPDASEVASGEYGEMRLEPKPKQCTWKQDVDDGSWDTDCGNKFCIENGTPSDNGMLFCCYCGAKLVTPNVDVTGAGKRRASDA